ncbi:nucleotidyl transferase AbiEii/AbiGii toxin family protein [candidate division KSB1 bacterium]|nr:nucleotidyl transferase AbiEii/AbiGii toxin family protein [candidate division KSB1 bacterium]
MTGGTALSVFYLHHRVSNDLDLFTVKDMTLADIDFSLRTIFQRVYYK